MVAGNDLGYLRLNMPMGVNFRSEYADYMVLRLATKEWRICSIGTFQRRLNQNDRQNVMHERRACHKIPK